MKIIWKFSHQLTNVTQKVELLRLIATNDTWAVIDISDLWENKYFTWDIGIIISVLVSQPPII